MVRGTSANFSGEGAMQINPKSRIDFSLPTQPTGVATGAAADVTPTLDRLHEQDPTAHPETSAYTLTETTDTTGDNIYLIDGKYYKLEIKGRECQRPWS